MNKISRTLTSGICTAALALGSANIASASLFHVTVDTAALVGQTGTLHFDLIGNGASINTSTISSFITDGIIGSAGLSGTGSGDLSAMSTLSTTSFFNELAQNITYGTQFSFDLKLTENTPNFSGTPDDFSLFLADNNGKTIPTTTDPTGNNALFMLAIDGTASGDLSVYSASDFPINWLAVPVTAIPIPSIAWLLLTGIMVTLRISKNRP